MRSPSFSHHRVTTPPPAWVRTAHRFGTKILGTLIFEWDEGERDVLKLVVGPERDPAALSTSFSLLDTSYADALVALCVERGFDGWLVNVEVSLGARHASGRLAAREHAQSLVAWLEYLRFETNRVISGGEVLWYDAVTIEGKLHWQSTLTDLNAPFFLASDGLFTDYHWRQTDPAAAIKSLDSFPSRRPNDVFFGIDVYGRGQYGGGGFDCFRALEVVTSPSTSNLSLAIFAPGWTVESEHLGHSLTSREGFQRWKDDDRYLWLGGKATPNATRERKRQDEARREERGRRRARELALAFSPTPTPRPRLEHFDYHAPLAPVGPHRGISTFFSSRPMPLIRRKTLFSCFSNGSGHAFYFEGSKMLESDLGWTDVDFQFAQPSLALESHLTGVTTRMTEDDAWIGEQCLLVEASPSSSTISVPLISLDNPSDPQEVVVDVVFKSSQDVVLGSTLESDMIPFTRYPPSVTDLREGWKKASLHFKPRPTRPSSPCKVGFEIAALPDSTVVLLVGAVSVSFDAALTPQPRVVGLEFDASLRNLRWSITHKLHLSSDAPVAPWPSFAFFSVWYLPEGAEDPDAAVFVGVTPNSWFNFGEKLGRGKLAVRGIDETGRVDAWDDTWCTC